jgi:hypothetical protein
MIMKELMNNLIETKSKYSNWSIEKLNNILENIKNEKDISVDYDFGTGEEWASIIKDNDRIGMIGVKLPVAFLKNEFTFLKKYIDKNDLIIIAIDDFDADKWSIDLNKFRDEFEFINWHASAEAVNPNCLSINDFWFATI